MDFTIVHHHVGARGNVAMPLRGDSPLRQDMAFYYYDADADALNAGLRGIIQAGHVELLPYCIGGAPGRRPFHLARDRFASSLYPANPHYDSYTAMSNYGSNVFGEGHGLDRIVEVEVTPLDMVCGADGKPAPDYLSIDAEGAELDILTGASRVLDESVLMVRSEIWIHPVYRGAPTMAETLALLQRKGFDLVAMEQYDGHEPRNMPLGTHGEGITLGDEATFIKQPERVLAAGEDPEARQRQFYKLALFSMLLGQTGLAHGYLTRAQQSGGTFFRSGGDEYPAGYLKFLHRVQLALAGAERTAPKIPNLYKLQWQMRRFRQIEANDRNGERTRAARAALAAEANKLVDLIGPKLEAISRLYMADTTHFEQLLREHGLTGQADTVAGKRRSIGETFVRNYLMIATYADRNRS